jgi:hypothetical protein
MRCGLATRAGEISKDCALRGVGGVLSGATARFFNGR